MILKIAKYFFVGLVLFMAFQTHSIVLDKLFYSLEGIRNEEAISMGYSHYFPYFIGFYGIIVIVICILFELAVYAIPGLNSYKRQLLVAAVIGLIIGYLVGDGNLSYYHGKFQNAKSLLLYTLLGITFVLLKWVCGIRTASSTLKLGKLDVKA